MFKFFWKKKKCRICFSGARPLVHPCQCSGSIKYVHQHCLERWIRTRNGGAGDNRCEICGHKFPFEFALSGVLLIHYSINPIRLLPPIPEEINGEEAQGEFLLDQE